MPTRTRFVFLMHPKEFKYEKAGTGRLTHLALSESEIHMGVGFDDHAEVQALLKNPAYYPVLLYPGAEAVNLSLTAYHPVDQGNRQLLVILLDATWACAKKMLKLSPTLQALPRLMFTPQQKSRFIIKQQPAELCLSTLEATHELLLALEGVNMDTYSDKEQLLRIFDEMQKFQIQCANDPERAGYRRGKYKDPTLRKLLPETSRHRRNLLLK